MAVPSGEFVKLFIHKSLCIVVLACAINASANATSYTLITEPNQGLTSIYDLINSAQHTIDMTMYELSDTTAEQDLVARAAAGVTVRVILDINLEESNNQAAYTYLNANGVQCHWANTTYAATHQKTITIDGAYSNAQTAIMTLNLTPQYYSTSRDFAIIENDPNDISAIETTFEADFNSTSITPPVGDDLVWSPTNSQSAMVGLINAAEHTLLVENEEMSDTAIVNALVSAAERGVNVQIIMNAGTYTSEWAEITKAGGDVSTYPATQTGLYIHAKVIIADYGYSTGSFFQGSENFSSASLTENRELGLIINNLPVMASLVGTLTSDFNGGTPQTGSPSDFTLTPSVSTLTVAAGSTGTATLTATPFNSFKTAVSLSAFGLPSGVTASFSAASITGAIKNSTAVNLTVSGGTPSFSLSASPSSLSVQEGNSGSSTVTSAVSGGFSSTVALTASGLPSGVTAAFSPASIAGGAGTSTLTLTASGAAAVGTSTVTITGKGGGLTETATLSLTITSGVTPGFTLSASPTSLSVQEGKSGTSTITSSASGGFSSAVALSASGLPTGVTASFSPASISGGQGTSTLTLTASSTATVGTVPVTVTGMGGGVIETTSFSLTITSGTTPSFSLSASPSTVTVIQGSTGTSTITSTPSGGFSSAVSLSATGLPSGVTAAFSPSSISGGSGTSTLTFTASGTAALGGSSVTVTGTGGGLTETTPVSLTVNASSGGQLITDGGFLSATKSGLTAPGWTGVTNSSGHNLIIVNGSYGYNGDNNYGLVGGVDNTNDTLTQTISIPAGSTSTPLTFWLSIYTTETNSNGEAYDYFYVEIHNTSGTLLATPLTLSNLNGTHDKHIAYFQPQTIDLSAYAGQTIELVFHGTNDHEDATTFYIDDISVTAN
jgi:cardiolipin synthase